MVLSILHRMTGIGLALGAVLVTAWLATAMIGDNAFAGVQLFRDSLIGQLMFFGWLWAFCYHLLNGVRHLFWDAVIGVDMKSARITGWLVVLGSVAMTAVIWCKVGGAL